MGTVPAMGSAEELARFRELQAGLVSRFERFRLDPRSPYTAVVIPSQSFDPKELAKIAGVAHYEERSLFNLMLLQHPRLEVIFVTSKRLDPLIVDYYLHQIRGVPSAHARRRLHLLDCDDATPIPLSQKILDRARLCQRIEQAIGDPSMAHMVVFNATPLERSLAVRLGIPVNACDPELCRLGSKTGSRQVFREAGLSIPAGREGLRDVDDLVVALDEVWRESPDSRRMVVKLNDSFSGEGNAILDLRPLAGVAPGAASSADRREVLREALPRLEFEAAGLTWDAYAAQFAKMGGVCERWVEGEGKRSPSTQLRINPMGEVQVVSTHDQLLGGPTGQCFEGATFPADRRYRLAIQDAGRRVGEVLARHGVLGRFGVDFLVVPGKAQDDVLAVEINMRQGGTTHPFNTLKFITDGHFDEDLGVFCTAQGLERCYFATDTLSSPRYRGLMPFDVLDEMVLEGLHFRSDETGVVFHLLGCISEFGKLGLTAVAPTVEQALGRYRDAVRILDRMADRHRCG
ncbi:MAG: peptide ligase PGM1-related protein [Polyangiaceae bacterium]